MLTDTPGVDGSNSEDRALPEASSKDDSPDVVSFLVRRKGLEQEFFLVDRRGALSDQADTFLRRCREAAQMQGLDPRCFQTECVMSLVEITTPPSSGFASLAKGYLGNLGLALKVASELGLALYPLGTYPLPISPTLRDDPRYAVKANTIGRERFSHAGRCAGAHLHLELPAGTVWPDVKAALGAPLAAQRELLGLYNLATALDPALVALTRSCPFYEGELVGFAARTVHYRGILGFDGLYANLREVGGLSAYASDVADLIYGQSARYRAWYAAMDRAGVERRLFAQAGGNLHRAAWNPVRLSHHGTVEIRSMDANFPEVVLAVCALVCGAAERVRREHLKVIPSTRARTLEVHGDLLVVPRFSYLNGELLAVAVTKGVEDRKVEAYLDSFVGFASPYLEEPELVESLVPSGGYETTEAEILANLALSGVALTRNQGLSLVQEACRRLEVQVGSLCQRYDVALPGDEPDPRAASVVPIRDSPPISTEDARPVSVDVTQPTARAENKSSA